MSQTVVITGASSGIGRATAAHFQAQGWNVVATMRNPDDAGDLAQMDNVMVGRLDVTDQVSIDQAVQATLDRFGRIDVLVNNAGYGAFGTLEAFSMERVRRQYETNVLGLIAVIKAVVPHFRGQKSGVLINVSSMGGRMGWPVGSLYHSTKFAIEGLSESLQFEFAGFGGLVKLIEPGRVDTDFSSRSMDIAHDPELTEYLPIVGGFQKAAAAATGARSSGADCAEAIFQAATDGTDTLRYVVGDDAKGALGARSTMDDDAFRDMQKQQFNLT